MEIKLTEKQQKLIEGAFSEQQNLQAQAQAELNKIQKRIDDAVLLILDTHGLEVVEGIKYNAGMLIVPDKTEVEAPQMVVEENHKE